MAKKAVAKAKPVMIQLLYWNVRCLGDDWKQALTLENLNSINKNTDVTMLSETKCKKKLDILGKNAFQTELSGQGGAVAIHTSSNAKIIKSLDQNVLWTTDIHDGALVNYVTLYIPPNSKEFAELSLRRLKWILYRIFLIDKYSKVVVAGDFNRIGMKETKFLESHFHLTPVVDPG